MRLIDPIGLKQALAVSAILEDKKTIEQIIDEQPSVQPEIIRCKDCKHKHIENMVWTCPFGLPGGPDFYCGYGAERRPDEQIDIR